MSTTTQARQDAREYARARMFYGEGAGTRRRLIQATVESRSKNPDYARAFQLALAHQDMAEHAKKARIERLRKDRSQLVSRNVRGMLTGNSRALNTSVLVVATAVYFAHQTGLDKKIIAKTKEVVADVKEKVRRRRQPPSSAHIYDITHAR